MNPGKLVGWKLIFRVNQVAPGQEYTVCVQPRHPFKGQFFMFLHPDRFILKKAMLGHIPEMMVPVPCAVLQAQDLMLDVCHGQVWNLEIENTSKESSEFYGELHGKLLLRAEEQEPAPTDFEGPSQMVRSI